MVTPVIENYFNAMVTRVRITEDNVGRRFEDFLIPSQNNARVESASVTFVDAQGVRVGANYRIFLAAGADFLSGDLIIIGTDTTAKSWPILKLNDQRGMEANHLEVIV